MSETVNGPSLSEAEIHWRVRYEWMREHAEVLDKGWHVHHEACMKHIREALELPDASVPELVFEILRLKGVQRRLRATGRGVAIP